jgi:hypothetical protein
VLGSYAFSKPKPLGDANGRRVPAGSVKTPAKGASIDGMDIEMPAAACLAQRQPLILATSKMQVDMHTPLLRADALMLKARADAKAKGESPPQYPAYRRAIAVAPRVCNQSAQSSLAGTKESQDFWATMTRMRQRLSPASADDANIV